MLLNIFQNKIQVVSLLQIIKQSIKKGIKLLPVTFTKNQQYDRQTKAIIKAVCNSSGNCIDVGTHKGEIVDIF